MLQFLKKFAWAGLLALMVQGASAFSLLGPFDVWQTTILSYQQPGDLGGPQNLGEEYRYNIPVLYYAADTSFVDYFGSNGIIAIDKATAILNSLSKVSSYSSNLSEFPQEATRFNFRAQALGLTDLSSTALHILIENMGLAEPERYTWTLRSRIPAPSCPSFLYLVISRNFDPVTWEPTPYVNGTLYSYDIIEFCPVVDQADAIERRVDPLQHANTAVAAYGFFVEGSFYTGLTRDDVGGLRYLLSASNVNLEDSGPGTETFVTNNTPQLLTTSNLNFLAEAALTNNAGALQALFPGLVITSSSNYFTYVPVTNITATFANEPWAPAGTATLVLATNVTFTFQQIFQHTFGNIFTFQFGSNGPVVVPITNVFSVSNRVLNTIQTISATFPPFSTPGTNSSPTTNITTRTFITNQIAGEFFVLPPGVCDIAILSTLATNVVISTNVIVVSTNTFGATNVNGQFFSQTRVDYFTNHTFLTLPIICDTTNVSLNQGIEKVTFVRRDYDSLLGRFFHPITNEYVLNSITNSTIVQHRIRRVVTSPDIIFSAGDITDTAISYLRSPNFVSNNVPPGLNGPGLIEPITVVTFNKVGPLFENDGPLFMDEASNIRFFSWGFYDGTTNAPIVFPSGRSIMDLENQLLMHVTTTTLTGGTSGVAYSAQLAGVGGQAPITWSLAPGSATLPAGLGVYSAGCDCWLLPSNGLISGTPTIPGTYTFTVLMTDALNQKVTQDLTLIISP
jgi:hypothetical protein